jgi:hypothetical protein
MIKDEGHRSALNTPAAANTKGMEPLMLRPVAYSWMLIAALVVLLAAAPAPARARAASADRLASGGFAGETVATDSLVTASIEAAGRYWARQGMAVAPIDAFMYDSDTSLAQGEQPTADHPCMHPRCEIWLSRGDLAGFYAAPRKDRHLYAEMLCATITHERGHTLGLAHTPTGVMNPTAGIVTSECITVAQAFAPVVHQRRLRANEWVRTLVGLPVRRG